MTEWLSEKLNGDGVKTEVAYEDMVWFVKAKVDDVDFFASEIIWFTRTKKGDPIDEADVPI